MFDIAMQSRLPMVFLVAVLSACASAPTQDMADARIALRTAEQAGARERANLLLTRAKQSLAEAEALLESGLYSDARTSAQSAVRTALAARNVAEQIALAEQELAGAAKQKLELPAARAAVADAIAAAAAGKDEAAVRAARRAVESARVEVNLANLARARALRQSCRDLASSESDLARADAEIARRRGAEALEILQRVCPQQ